MTPSLAPRRPLITLLIFAIGSGIGLGGLALSRLSPEYTMIVWPAAGWALAATLGFGRAVWPGLWAASFVTMFVASGDVLWALAASVGFAVEPVVTAALVERVGQGVQAYRRPDTIFRLTTIVVGVGAPISATTVAVATALFGPADWSAFGNIWINWWLASIAGTLVIAPLVLLWTTTNLAGIRLWSVVEALVMLAALTIVSLIVFAGRFPADVKNYPLEFLCVPFLLWAAFRQGPRTVAIAAAILCGAAAWGTTWGFGPFVRDSSFEATVLVQAYIIVTATMAAVIAAVVADHHHAQVQLREMASTDPLTGLANYRRLLDVLRFEITRSNRTGRHFSVLFLDMDGLKAINDRHGHLAGSRALCRLADTLKQSCRAMDTTTRFGGDEFAIVLPESSEDDGYVVLKRISERLAALQEVPAIAVSGGVAVFPRDGSSPTQLLRSADKVLYEAKTRAASLRRLDDSARRTGTD